MVRLTMIHRNRLNAAMIEELLDHARRCSEEGDDSTIRLLLKWNLATELRSR